MSRWSFLLALAVLGPSPPGAAQVFVADREILVFAADADGDEAPVRRIGGPDTGFDFAQGIAFDAVNDELVVTAVRFAPPTGQECSVLVFGAGDEGNARPRRVISGPSTTLACLSSPPVGVAVDAFHDEIWVANPFGDPPVVVFDRLAEGDVEPLRGIGGETSGLRDARYLFVDTVNDELFVAQNDRTVRVYARTADGDAEPLRLFGSDEMWEPRGIFLDLETDEVYVIDNRLPSGFHVFERGSDGLVSPLRSVTTETVPFASPLGLVVTTAGEALVANFAEGVMAGYDALDDTATDPLRVLSGPATGMFAPASVTSADARGGAAAFAVPEPGAGLLHGGALGALGLLAVGRGRP
ncbi:MAG: hypothetical protein QNK03_05980 [Myxococcota bacterium]|nr:hypothetical protein [Myxococcota bacterium]